jgi:hypothetical protein
MADYATLLRDHVMLTCRSVDRIFLQAYVPKLQSVGGVCQFLYWQKGFSIPSSAAFTTLTFPPLSRRSCLVSVSRRLAEAAMMRPFEWPARRREVRE